MLQWNKNSKSEQLLQDSGNGLNGNGGFTLVDEAGGETAVGGHGHGQHGQQGSSMSSLGRKLQTTAELFDVISGNGEVGRICQKFTGCSISSQTRFWLT